MSVFSHQICWRASREKFVSELEEAGINTLSEGEAVSFEVGESRGKEKAINIKKI